MRAGFQPGLTSCCGFSGHVPFGGSQLDESRHPNGRTLTAMPIDTPITVTRPATWQRVAVAVFVGALAMLLTLKGPGAEATTRITDFVQPWFAALAILNDADPYRLVGPNGVYAHEFTLFYPLTAAVAVIPLGLLPEWQAAAAF